MLKPNFNELINNPPPQLLEQEGDFPTLKKALIVTLAWLMKDAEGQTPDCLDLKQFTDNSQLITEFEGIMENHWNTVGDLNRDHSADELRNYILYLNNSAAESLPLKQLILKLLDIQADDSIMLLNTGIETELLDINVNYPENPVTIVDSQENLLIAEVKSRILGMTPVFYDNQNLGVLRSVTNKVLGFDRVSKSISSSRLRKEGGADAADCIERSAACLVEGTGNKAVICVDSRKMLNSKTVSDLLQSKRLEAVILLNEHSFLGECLIYILSQNNDHVRMVDANDCYTETGRGARSKKVLTADDAAEVMQRYENQNTVYSRLVPYAEIAWNDYDINPLHYLSPHNGLPNATPLGEVCEIKRGTMLSSKKLDEIASDKPTDYRFVSLKHLSETGLDNNLPYLQSIDDRQQKYCLKNGQVIVTKMSPFRVATVNIPDEQTYLASGNLYFLDIDADKVSPIYLKMFLESEQGVAQLDRLSKGTAVRTISIADLKQVKIPLIPLSEQHKTAKEYQRLEAEVSVLKNKLNSLVSSQRNVIIDKIDGL